MSYSRRSDSGRRSGRISGPADVVQAIPYLLGFHPRDSLVLLGMAHGRLVVTCRVDLADLGEPELLRHTLAALARGGSDRVVGAVYDDSPLGSAAPWRGLADEMIVECAAVGCELAELLRVSRGRWRSYLCDDPRCCPPDGRPLPDRPSPFALQSTVGGRVVHSDRAALAATLAPLPEPEPNAMSRIIDELLDRPGGDAGGQPGSVRAPTADRAGVPTADPAGVPTADPAGVPTADPAGVAADSTCAGELLALARRRDPGGRLSDVGAARFGIALRSIEVRDRLWLEVDARRADGRELWRDLGRRLPGVYAAAPLFLYGWASWRAGDGALANLAADRAVQADPQYSAADLLASLLAQAIDPRTFPCIADQQRPARNPPRRPPPGRAGARRAAPRPRPAA